MLEIFLNIQNSYQKILQKFQFYESRLIKGNQELIEGFFSIDQMGIKQRLS